MATFMPADLKPAGCDGEATFNSPAFAPWAKGAKIEAATNAEALILNNREQK